MFKYLKKIKILIQNIFSFYCILIINITISNYIADYSLRSYIYRIFYNEDINNIKLLKIF